MDFGSENAFNVTGMWNMPSDPEERKLTRRLRVQRKTEVLRRQQLDVTEVEEECVPKSLLESQVEKSENHLQNLLTEGNELVTNVRVANDAREVKRRAENADYQRLRMAKLEEELVASAEQLAVINTKWDGILESKDPLDFYHDIAQQKDKCNELIKQKDNVIDELRKELLRHEDQFIRDQKKHREDLALLCERMENQVAVMKRAFKEELKLIEEVIGAEHTDLLDHKNKRWEELFAQQDQVEAAGYEKKMQVMQAFEEQMRAVHLEQEERHRERKIQMEEDVQALQQELQQIKALCLLNTEKLDYNYQVLKKRDDENLVLKSRQKRQLNRLQDTVNNLKEKIVEKERREALESSRLADEVKRLKLSITNVENKAKNFTEMNDRKFQQLWDLNTERAKALLDKILTVDRIIHEQQLGLEWEPPELQLLQKTDLESYRSAMQIVAELFRQKDRVKPESEQEKYIKAMRAEQAETFFLQQILQKVANASGFLIEERLKNLLEKYSEQEQTLITIDTVFNALGVTSKKDMAMLKKYFLPYCYCIQCGAVEEAPEEEIISNPDSEEDTLHSDPSLGAESLQHQDAASNTTVELLSTGTAPVTSLTGDLDVSQDVEADRTNQPTSSRGYVDFKPRQICIVENHSLGIDDIYILKALRGFVEKFHEKVSRVPDKPTLLLGRKHNTVSRLLTHEDIVLYWNRFLEIFDSKREELWDAVYVGLLKYRDLLEDRHLLNQKTKQLRLQNAELRRLLQAHMMDNAEVKTANLPAELVAPSREARKIAKTVAFPRR